MKLSGFASASVRRTLVSVGLGAVLCAATGVYAQEAPAAAQPAAPAPAAAADPFKFSSPSALVLWTIKPEAIADFENLWATVRDRIAASDKPAAKAALAGVKMFKVSVPPPPTPPAEPQPAFYIFYIDSASPTQSYSPIEFLYTSDVFLREEADKLLATLQASAANIAPWPLQPMAGVAAAPAAPMPEPAAPAAPAMPPAGQ
jgi:hypothetical protein